MIDINKLKREKERIDLEQSGGINFWKIPEGENLVYICPPLPTDDVPFLEVMFHYEVGNENRMCVCLDEEKNQILKHPRIKELLAASKKDIEDGCHVCRGLDEGQAVGRDAASRYVLGVIPLKYRKNSSRKWREADEADEHLLLTCGYTVWSGIVDVIINNGDITDPKKAILVRVGRKGQGMRTRYEIAVDTDSVREPVLLSKSLRAMIKKTVAQDAPGDLYKAIAGMVKSSSEVEGLITGVQMEDDDENESKDSAKRPDCFGEEYDANDSECEDCDYFVQCESKYMMKPDGKDSEPEETEDKVDDEDMAALDKAIKNRKKSKKNKKDDDDELPF